VSTPEVQTASLQFGYEAQSVLGQLCKGAAVNQSARMEHLVKITGRFEFISLTVKQWTGGAIAKQ
jgi:hypothetical protein